MYFRKEVRQTDLDTVRKIYPALKNVDCSACNRKPTGGDQMLQSKADSGRGETMTNDSE